MPDVDFAAAKVLPTRGSFARLIDGFKLDRSALVGTRLGVIAQRFRESVEMHRGIGKSVQDLGEFANNKIARQLLEALCLPGKVFVDVGSHIGSVIDGAKRHSSPSSIIAIEAIPEKAAALRRRFPDVIIHDCAAGDHDDRISFYVDTCESGYSSLYPNRNIRHLQQIEVSMRRLDDLLAGASVDMMKIDVEGAELSALRGAATTLSECKPSVMFESGPAEVGGLSKADLWSFLDKAGYSILLPNRVAHQDPGLSCEGFAEAHMYPRRTTNYFAVHHDRREEVRARARMILGL